MRKKNIVVIVVYNRYENLVRWLDCWEKCDKEDSQFVVIHNYDAKVDYPKYKALCKQRGVTYIQRRNRGMDIGAFQDVVKERLTGFDNDWDTLLWITDDFIPMRKDFVKVFTSQMKIGVAIVGNEISRENVLHLRTSGFCIKKDVSKKILFPVDPIQDKGQCYNFEHGQFNLLKQIQRTKQKVLQATHNVQTAPLWDTEIRHYLKRMDEFHSVFSAPVPEPISIPTTETVTFICPIYNSYPEILSSLINQTHKEWRLLLIHDGPNSTGLKELVEFHKDPRIIYIETPTRQEKWGHPIRQWALNEIKEGRLVPETEYIVITNGDNHLVPVFCEYLLTGFKKNPSAVATYCSQMVHGYLSNQITTIIPNGVTTMNNLRWENWRWGIIQCRLKLGYIDCSCAMIRKNVACEAGWRSMDHSSDWIYFSDIIKTYGEDKWERVNGCLLIHN